MLYLRGPSMSSIASRRFEGLDSAKPKNVDVKSVKVQGSTAESAYTAVSSWLNLSTVKPEGTRVIASQNADFIFGARKAFETTSDAEKKKCWRAVRGRGHSEADQAAGGSRRVSRGCATSLTMEIALERLVRGMKKGSQPPEKTFVEAHSYPSLEELAKKGTGVSRRFGVLPRRR